MVVREVVAAVALAAASATADGSSAICHPARFRPAARDGWSPAHRPLRATGAAAIAVVADPAGGVPTAAVPVARVAPGVAPAAVPAAVRAARAVDSAVDRAAVVDAAPVALRAAPVRPLVRAVAARGGGNAGPVRFGGPETRAPGSDQPAPPEAPVRPTAVEARVAAVVAVAAVAAAAVPAAMAAVAVVAVVVAAAAPSATPRAGRSPDTPRGERGAVDSRPPISLPLPIPSPSSAGERARVRGVGSGESLSVRLFARPGPPPFRCPSPASAGDQEMMSRNGFRALMELAPPAIARAASRSTRSRIARASRVRA